MSKTDFFEFPIGDTYRECIEVETDYERGVMDERKRWEDKRCKTCSYCDYTNGLQAYCETLECSVPANIFSCILHEEKATE